MPPRPGPDHWVILIAPRDVGRDVRAVSKRWPKRKTTALPRLMARFATRLAAERWLGRAVEPGGRHRFNVAEERLAEYPARVADEVRIEIEKDRLKAERKAEREARRAAGARDDLNFCGEFSPAEEEATRAFVEEVRREGEWDLDGPPISPEAMPKLTGPPKKRTGRKAAAQA